MFHRAKSLSTAILMVTTLFASAQSFAYDGTLTWLAHNFANQAEQFQQSVQREVSDYHWIGQNAIAAASQLAMQARTFQQQVDASGNNPWQINSAFQYLQNSFYQTQNAINHSLYWLTPSVRQEWQQLGQGFSQIQSNLSQPNGGWDR